MSNSAQTSASSRIAALLDENSFVEVGAYIKARSTDFNMTEQETPADGVVTAEFAYRLKVKGGLTGYAQVYGKYNTTAYDKLKMDLMYIQNYSLLLDIEILFKTIKILFEKESTEGFSSQESEAMEHETEKQDVKE